MEDLEDISVFETIEDFKEYFQSLGYDYAKKIINKCFELNKSNKQDIIVSRALVKEGSYNFIISIDKRDLLNTLQQYLPLFEEKEDYEECARVFNLIKKISK